MTVILGVADVAMGLVYIGIGVLILVDLRRGWSTRGFSHLGAALIALAFTCGPYHVMHGIHLLEGVHGGVIELVTVLIGLPPGWMFARLRVEAFMGGRGDRLLAGTPTWIELLPLAGATYAAAVLAAIQRPEPSVALRVTALPDLALVGVYAAIAAVLVRSQLAQREARGGWSLSGLSLLGIFATCTPMHATTAAVTLGQASGEIHAPIAAAFGIPAGLYFLWVVWALSGGRLVDWDRRPDLTGIRESAIREPTLVGSSR